MAELWKGAPVAAALTERLCGQAERLRARGISPTLAIVRVGERWRISPTSVGPASAVK